MQGAYSERTLVGTWSEQIAIDESRLADRDARKRAGVSAAESVVVPSAFDRMPTKRLGAMTEGAEFASGVPFCVHFVHSDRILGLPEGTAALGSHLVASPRPDASSSNFHFVAAPADSVSAAAANPSSTLSTVNRMHTLAADVGAVAPGARVVLSAQRDRLALRFPSRPAREQSITALTAAAAPCAPGSAVARGVASDYEWVLMAVVDGKLSPDTQVRCGSDAVLVHAASGSVMAVPNPEHLAEQLTDEQRDHLAGEGALGGTRADGTVGVGGRTMGGGASVGVVIGCGEVDRVDVPESKRGLRAGHPEGEADDSMRTKQLWAMGDSVNTLTSVARGGQRPPEEKEWRVGSYRLDGGGEPGGTLKNCDWLDGRTANVAALDCRPDELRADAAKANEMYRHGPRSTALYGQVEGSPRAEGTLVDRVGSRTYPRALHAGGPVQQIRSKLDSAICTQHLRKANRKGGVLRPLMVIPENGRLKSTPDAHHTSYPASGSNRLPLIETTHRTMHMPRGSKWTAQVSAAPEGSVVSDGSRIGSIVPPRDVPRARLGGLISTTLGTAASTLTASDVPTAMMHHSMRNPRVAPGSYVGRVSGAIAIGEGEDVPLECIIRLVPPSIASPTPPVEEGNSILLIRRRLLQRCGRLGIRPLARALRAACMSRGSRCLAVPAVVEAFAQLSLALSAKEVAAVRDVCDVVAASVAGAADSRADGVNVPELLQLLRGEPLSTARREMAVRGYALACSATAEGEPPTLRSMCAVYDPARLPDVLRGRATAEYFREAFTRVFADADTPSADAASDVRVVTMDDWMDYVLDIAPGLGADEDFVAHVCGVWPQVNLLAETGSL